MKRKGATQQKRKTAPAPIEETARVEEPLAEWGTVASFVRRNVSPAGDISPATMIARIRAGLPIGELDELQSRLDLPMERLAPKLGISKATLHRRRQAGRLATDESDKVMRFARILGQAAEVFEDEEAARRWLNTPQVGLGGAMPLDYAETEAGAREVERLLTRIEYGVYS